MDNKLNNKDHLPRKKNSFSVAQYLVQRKEAPYSGTYLIDNRSNSKQNTIQTKPNNTGLPDTLKSGIENMSGYTMDDVKVHYNSNKPAQLNAHAYAQGTDIHLGSGQEKYLPHEAWHVVQQKQGRVQPTTSFGEAQINDNVDLENEADLMGGKALQMKFKNNEGNMLQGFGFVDNRQESIQMQKKQDVAAVFQLQKLVPGILNVVGEHHSESNGRRDQEEEIATREVGGGYWTEDNFRIRGTEPSEELVKDTDEDSRIYGDALYLRIAESIQYVEEYKNDFIEHWNMWTSEEILPEECAHCKGELQKILVKCKTFICEAAKLSTLYLKNEEMATLPDLARTVINELNLLLPEAVAIFESLATNWKSHTLDELINFSFLSLFEVFSSKVDTLVPYAKELAGSNLDETSKLRSYEMDNAATHAHDRVGVWKIGFDHVAHIKELMGAEGITNYVLINRDEFNDEYKELPVLRDGTMQSQE